MNFPYLLNSYFQLVTLQLVSALQKSNENFLREQESLLNSAYQTQYAKNYEMIKSKYKKMISPTISYHEIKNYIDSPIENRGFFNGIYCFLSSLAFYEINTKKNRLSFESKDWLMFTNLFNHTKVEEIISLNEEIFKKNPSNYKWSVQEDLLLQKIVLKSNITNKKKTKWQEIAQEFNQSSGISQKRKASHCHERWKNTLNKPYKRGHWTKEEDINIISYVLNNGTKWSKLAKTFTHRTEHNLKNRFFSLLSKNLAMPIRKIKKSLNYLNKNILEDVRNGLDKL